LFLTLILCACNQDNKFTSPAGDRGQDPVIIEANKESIKISSHQMPSLSSVTLEINAEEAWDLLLISDSTGWGVADQFNPMVEADLGIKVKQHNFAFGGLSAPSVINDLRGPDSLDNCRELMKFNHI